MHGLLDKIDVTMHKDNPFLSFFLIYSDDSHTGCLDFLTTTAKVNCAVPLCSEMECVPPFHEELSGTIHNCAIGNEVKQIPCIQVEPRYIPRNVDLREARREKKIKTLQATIKELNIQGKTIHTLQAKLDTLTKELMSTKKALDDTLILADSFQKQNDMLSKQLKMQMQCSQGRFSED